MKYVVEIPAELYDQILLLATARQTRFSPFVEAALRNQIALENSDEGPVASRSPTPERAASSLARPPISPETWTGLKVDDLPWSNVEAPAKIKTTDGPLWGQYNRLFPLKFALRILAKQVAFDSKVTLASFYKEAGERAVGARKTLEVLDEGNEIPRGERLSAAFPQERDLALKRFREQFLGRLTRDGTAVGALPEMGFVGIAPGEEAVTLTQAGLEFAKIRNPIIDGASQTDALSAAEADFLIKHLAEHVRGEFDFLVSILEWIRTGTNRPDNLTAQVAKAWPKWTDKMANTMRSGALGRLHDLGLVARERTGLEVQYMLPERGIQFMKEPEKWTNGAK